MIVTYTPDVVVTEKWTVGRTRNRCPARQEEDVTTETSECEQSKSINARSLTLARFVCMFQKRRHYAAI